MKASVTIDIDAPAERVWAVISNVERWPLWTPSVRSIRRLDPGPRRVGARHRIKQPRLPTTTWTVTELIEGESFAWTATGPGIWTSARSTASRRRPRGHGLPSRSTRRGSSDSSSRT
jgi:uncharacterized membrane protein